MAIPDYQTADTSKRGTSGNLNEVQNGKKPWWHG